MTNRDLKRYMADEQKIVKLIVHRRDAVEQLTQIVNGTDGFKAIQKNASQRPDLIIFELNNLNDLSDLHAHSVDEGTDEIWIIANSKNPDFLMQAMRAGVKDFFTFPIKIEEIRESLYRFNKRLEQTSQRITNRKCTIISVAGSKGGVGTTTVAVNLAAALARQRKKGSVALVDMNTLFGEIPLFLDLMPKFNWGDIIRNIDRIDDTFLMNILARHRSGISVLSSPGNIENNLKPDPQIIERLFRFMKTMFEFIIVDLGQMADENYIRTMQLSDLSFLIATQTLPCLTNTNRLMKTLVNYGFLDIERIHVVLNRYVKKSEITLKNAEESIEKELYFVLPNDYNTTMSAINNGQTVNELAPKSEIAERFITLAEKVSPTGQNERSKKKSFFYWR